MSIAVDITRAEVLAYMSFPVLNCLMLGDINEFLNKQKKNVDFRRNR